MSRDFGTQRRVHGSEYRMGDSMILNRTISEVAALTVALITVLVTHPVVLAESPSVIEVGPFSAETAINPLPARWEPFNFKNIERHTHYQLIEENGQVVIRVGDGLNDHPLPTERLVPAR